MYIGSKRFKGVFVEWQPQRNAHFKPGGTHEISGLPDAEKRLEKGRVGVSGFSAALTLFSSWSTIEKSYGVFAVVSAYCAELVENLLLAFAGNCCVSLSDRLKVCPFFFVAHRW